MTIEILAAKVLAVLRLQAEFFAERGQTKLHECRDAERRLKSLCEEILNQTPAGLFDGEPP